MKLRPLKIKEKKSVALRIPDDSHISLTACKHAYNYLTKPARLFFLLSELYGRGSMENKALENEKLSTKHPKGRNRTERPKSKTKSNPNSKMKHPNSKTKHPICQEKIALTRGKDQIFYC